MASRADNVASTLNLANFSKATELKNRIWFTLAALVVFRFLSFVPLPGIDPIKLQNFMDRNSGGILDFFNNDVMPIVYDRGSLGASGDLAPLANLFLPLIGVGDVYYKGKK